MKTVFGKDALKSFTNEEAAQFLNDITGDKVVKKEVKTTDSKLVAEVKKVVPGAKEVEKGGIDK